MSKYLLPPLTIFPYTDHKSRTILSFLSLIFHVFRLSIRPLINFLLFFAVIFFAFAMFGFAVFGRTNKDYYNMVSTMESLFSMMLMNFNFNALCKSHK